MKIIYKNLITFFFIFILNFILFNSLLILKRKLIPNIIFYEGIYISIISSTLVFLLFFLFYQKKINEKLHNYFYQVIISFLLILIFHITIITIVDRSISVFMLSQINNHEPDKEYIIQSFKEKFTSEAVEKRLNEQIKINNIKLLKNENNSTEKYIITTKGSIYINIFQLINKIFNLDKFIVKRDLDEKSN